VNLPRKDCNHYFAIILFFLRREFLTEKGGGGMEIDL